MNKHRHAHKTYAQTGNIFTNHVSDKVLVSRMHKELSKFIIKITRTTMKRMGKRFYQTFDQRR